MARVVPIEDADDDRVADYVRLTDPDLRRLRERSDGEAGGFFIAEGVIVIRQLLRSSYRVRSLLVSPRRYDALEPELLARVAPEVPVYVASQEVVNAVSGYPLHRGALASAERRTLDDPGALVRGADLVVVTEGLNDHENLGALFRNAAAFGADTVLLDPTSCDPLYRRSIRVSMGHVLHVPFTRVSSIGDAVASLHAVDFEVVALTPAADAEDILRLSDRRRRALLVGAEGPGLSDQSLRGADRRVRIPMARGVDSLNVATAAAVALYELDATRRDG